MKWPTHHAQRTAERCAALIDHAPRLQAVDPERLAETIVRACLILRDPHTPLGQRARRELPASSGLSPPMVDWALRTSLAVSKREWLSLIPMPPPAVRLVPRALSGVFLAGNVLTVPLRAVLLPLLLRSPIIAKASSREALFPRLLKDALDEVEPEVGAAVGVVDSTPSDREVEQTILEHADVVSIYGSDATLSAVRAAAPDRLTLIEHGHGLGAIYVPCDAGRTHTHMDDLISAIALDAGAYDQLGCLSPHAVLVEHGFPDGAQRLAERVAHEGFAELERRLPRGPCSLAMGAAQLQWRGVAAACGELFEGEGYATSYEGSRPLRVSCGFRNLAFFDCEGLDDLVLRLAPWSRHLKCLGVAGDSASVRNQLAAGSEWHPYISAVGSVQTPPIDAPADGRHPSHGLVCLTPQ